MTKEQDKTNLPSLQELFEGSEVMARQNKLNVLLNQPPKKEWLNDHPMAKREIKVKNENGAMVKKIVPVQYLPIERVKYLLNRLFVKHRIEVKSVQIIANSVQVTVRLHYIDPITEQWDWHDGVGAAPINTKSGAKATDFTEVLPMAVQQATPSAKSYAVKDAAHEIGKLFGRDINSADDIEYNSLAGTFDMQDVLRKRIGDLLELIQDEDLHAKIVDQLITAEDNGRDNTELYRKIIADYGTQV